MRNGLIILALIIFVIGIVLIAAPRLSNDALAVVIGSLCGITARYSRNDWLGDRGKSQFR